MIFFGPVSGSWSYFSVGFGSGSGSYFSVDFVSLSWSGSYILNISFTFEFPSCKYVRLHIITRYKLFRDIFSNLASNSFWIRSYPDPDTVWFFRIRTRIRILLTVSDPSESGATTLQKRNKKIINLQLLMYESSPVKPYQCIHLHMDMVLPDLTRPSFFLAACQLAWNYLLKSSIDLFCSLHRKYIYVLIFFQNWACSGCSRRATGTLWRPPA